MTRTTYWTIKSKILNIDMSICNLASFTRNANLSYLEVFGKIQKARKEKHKSVTIQNWIIGWHYDDPIQKLLNLKGIKPLAPPPPRIKSKRVHIPRWSDRFIGRQCFN